MFAQTNYSAIITLNRTFIQNALIVLLASMLLGLASQPAIHLWWPVPITLQSAMVVFLGLSIGSKRALAAIALYLTEGAVGLPVFAGGLPGLPILMGPSGGYLWGFLPAVFLVGLLMEKGMAKNVFTAFVAAIIGSSIIFVSGVLRLQMIVGWEKAYVLGVQPFLIIEPIKLLIVSVIATFCWKKNTLL